MGSVPDPEKDLQDQLIAGRIVPGVRPEQVLDGVD